MLEVEELRVEVLDCFEEFLLRLVNLSVYHVVTDCTTALLHHAILVAWHMVAESQPSLLMYVVVYSPFIAMWQVSRKGTFFSSSIVIVPPISF